MNLKFAAHCKMGSKGLGDHLLCAARRFGLAAQAEVPRRGLWTMPRCAANVGLAGEREGIGKEGEKMGGGGCKMEGKCGLEALFWWIWRNYKNNCYLCG